MGRPLHRPTGPIRKPSHDSPSLHQLSASLSHAARALRYANNSLNVSQQTALNTAYRHATRTAHLLHTLYGATTTHDSDDDHDDHIFVVTHPPFSNSATRDRFAATDPNPTPVSQTHTSSPTAAPNPAPSRRHTHSPSAPPSLRRRDRHHHYEMLLRRAERMPRLPLPPALRESVTELAERTLQFVEQRRLAEEGTTPEQERDASGAHARRVIGATRRMERLVGVRVLQLPPLPQVAPLSTHFADVAGEEEQGEEDADASEE